ncbi:hypothetical protein JKP88DRAFT_251689 [Tribonema minus]|uniref:Uncharacterized protein n=1 Tax=Tribonema minus TaxID=303371 RepID=A0A835ZBI1_9STRA|nr:hypothetical protein JKP88DRAFT_251689 [Tribonema minus]
MPSAVDQLTKCCDLIIAACYIFIPTAILLFIRHSKISLSVAGAAPAKKIAVKLTISAAAFIYTCGATHLWRFTLLFGTSTIVGAVLMIMCACVSFNTVALLALNMHSIILMMSSIEANYPGRISELTTAYGIAEEYICDMLSVHRLGNYEFLHVNEACSAYGYEPAALSNLSLLDFTHPEDQPLVEAAVANLNAGDVGRSFMYRLLTAHGKYVQVETSCKAGRWDETSASFLVTRNVQGRLDQFHRDTVDHGDAVRIETNRIHAATSAHDLRTSVAIFELSVQEIRMGGQIDYALASAENALWFMKFILDRTIESCMVMQGQKPVAHLEDVFVGPLLHHVIDMLSTYPHSVSVTCDVAPDIDSRALICDAEWLKSILTSFISTAYDNTMYGSVKVSVRKEEQRRITFEIADTGVGVIASDLNKLFCPFSKLSSKVKIEHGLGIGLYNCAWRIRLLRGTYGVRNNAEGGCTFYFSLPLAPHMQLRNLYPSSALYTQQPTIRSTDANPLPARSTTDSNSEASHFGMVEQSMANLSVLIVDDVSTFRKLLKKQLERRGVTRIDEAEDGVNALEMMKHTQYSVVLMDVMMPRMNGDVCARELREWEVRRGTPNVPILLMSADVLSDENDVVTSGIVQHFFTKPIDIVRLGNTLRNIAVTESTQ